MTENVPTNSVSEIPVKKKGMFILANGQSVGFTFALVSSLFLLWGVCNGMIDVMDKHFQEELNLSLSQSAWVQFAHYLGYFLMAMPAGWLAIKLGYKGGIIAGLLLVAVGGFWFIPATHIAQFWAFLLGVCVLAAGLTFLETVANPYTTVLGDLRYAATRINLAQSCNGIGWILGPIIGGMFFYSKNAAGQSTGSQTLFIPYLIVAIVVLILAMVFHKSYIPDVKMEDDYHLDDKTTNVAHSIWKRPHFVMAVSAQFLYVAAQAGIFSFFINYMTAETPPIPNSWRTEWAKEWIDIKTVVTKDDIKDLSALAAKLKNPTDPVSAFLAGPDGLPKETVKELADYVPGSESRSLQASLARELNNLVKQDPKKVKPEKLLYDEKRFATIALSKETVELLTQKYDKPEERPNWMSPEDFQKMPAHREAKEPPKDDNEKLARFNRHLLVDAYPNILSYEDGVLGVSDKAASMLASVAFFCFLIGRFSGAGFLKKFSAHKVLGLYGIMNVIVCGLIFAKLGWFSVACVFVSYFFMSIMFPTIFALGIFGLGAGAKKASAFIVMAIMGGAVLPKLMGAVGDHYDMSRAFVVPLACFLFVAFYGFCWPKFSGADSLHSIKATGGH